MVKIFVNYAVEFNCYSKFHRKMEKIISKLDSVHLFFLHDTNNLISRLSSECHVIKEITLHDDFDSLDVTHAVIFDDNTTISKYKDRLESKKITTRKILTPITKSINIKREIGNQNNLNNKAYEYIGRGSYWGNPYSLYEDGNDRDEVIRKFKYDFDNDKFPNKEKSEVYKLHGKKLGCFCKPLACHGDILADFLNSWDDDK